MPRQRNQVRTMCISITGIVLATLFGLSPSFGAATDVLLIGYWPPTNEMLRPFSTDAAQNPDGWIGHNWEDRGYDIHAFFPEFPDGSGPKGVGDFEVDYQDTSEDFWRITSLIEPIAIITFSYAPGQFWEIEAIERNRLNWLDDYAEPTQPDVFPPDDSIPASADRQSSLPIIPIKDAVNAAQISLSVHPDHNLEAIVDVNGTSGAFLSGYLAYHGVWYHDLHQDPSDPAWNVAAGHVHVGGSLSVHAAREAAEVTLRTTLDYVDTIVPEPSTSISLLLGSSAWLFCRRPRIDRRSRND
jgi:hypothetical protein